MKIACIGGAHIDRHAVLKEPYVAGTSNPVNVATSFGGVARNVAENLARLGCEVAMVSRVGDDEAGRSVVAHLRSLGVDTSMMSVMSVAVRATASYTAVLQPDGELVMGLADMDVYDEIVPSLLDLPKLREYEMWFADANLPEATLAWLTAYGLLAVDAISVAKARKLRGIAGSVPVLFANTQQAAEIGANQLSRSGIVTAGASGITVWVGDDRRAMPALPAATKNVTGAGDALIAGTLYGMAEGMHLFEAARMGLAAAAITVEAPGTIAQDLTMEALRSRM